MFLTNCYSFITETKLTFGCSVSSSMPSHRSVFSSEPEVYTSACRNFLSNTKHNDPFKVFQQDPPPSKKQTKKNNAAKSRSANRLISATFILIYSEVDLIKP